MRRFSILVTLAGLTVALGGCWDSTYGSPGYPRVHSDGCAQHRTCGSCASALVEAEAGAPREGVAGATADARAEGGVDLDPGGAARGG